MFLLLSFNYLASLSKFYICLAAGDDYFSDIFSEKLHLRSYLEMLWSETGYFGLLGNNLILFIILLYLIER